MDPLPFVLHVASNLELQWPGMMDTDAHGTLCTLTSAMWRRRSKRRRLKRLGCRLSSASRQLCDLEEAAYLSPKVSISKKFLDTRLSHCFIHV